jgi:hypothetical protein
VEKVVDSGVGGMVVTLLLTAAMAAVFSVFMNKLPHKQASTT